MVLPLATLTPGEAHFTLQQTPPPHLPYFLCFSSDFFQQDPKYQGAERPDLRSSSQCFRHEVQELSYTKSPLCNSLNRS